MNELNDTADLEYMRMALALAARATMATSPNPKVGCVIVKQSKVVGQGWTQPVGQAHAEVMALRDAAQQGHDVVGATAYVTLEPCSHYGRTPPCANALIEAKLTRVVAAIEDANPKVAGRGLAMLQAAGIQVQCGLLAKEAREINIGFFKRMETGKPWVRLKVAASIDGYTALTNGQSQWITGAQARQDGHVWRARADAILTGIGTVEADDPMMTVRGVETTHQPRKIVVDSHLRISPLAKIFGDDGILLVCANQDTNKDAALQAKGAEIIRMPNANSKVDLHALMLECGRREINELHIEAGAQLNGALIAANCVDELLVYLAPKLLGNGAGLFALPELTLLDQAPQFIFHDVQTIGDDVRLILRMK